MESTADATLDFFCAQRNKTVRCVRMRGRRHRGGPPPPPLVRSIRGRYPTFRVGVAQGGPVRLGHHPWWRAEAHLEQVVLPLDVGRPRRPQRHDRRDYHPPNRVLLDGDHLLGARRRTRAPRCGGTDGWLDRRRQRLGRGRPAGAQPARHMAEWSTAPEPSGAPRCGAPSVVWSTAAA